MSESNSSMELTPSPKKQNNAEKELEKDSIYSNKQLQMRITYNLFMTMNLLRHASLTGKLPETPIEKDYQVKVMSYSETQQGINSGKYDKEIELIEKATGIDDFKSEIKNDISKEFMKNTHEKLFEGNKDLIDIDTSFDLTKEGSLNKLNMLCGNGELALKVAHSIVDNSRLLDVDKNPVKQEPVGKPSEPDEPSYKSGFQDTPSLYKKGT